jgi:hypothetical protein
MSTGAVFFAKKKNESQRNSHLAGESSGSSISNGCQAKTKRRRQLTWVGTGRGGTKLHARVAGSRVTAFLATAAPWEPYFTGNPRISERNYTSSRTRTACSLYVICKDKFFVCICFLLYFVVLKISIAVYEGYRG